MPHEIAPIAVRASLLSGLSEQMVVGHYENHYGKAVRALNAVGRELAALDAPPPPNRLGRLKQEELALLGSVTLHELYFANLGGYRRAGPNTGLGRPDWHEVPDDFTQEIAEGSAGRATTTHIDPARTEMGRLAPAEILSSREKTGNGARTLMPAR
jgi:Fe-Mn family superoxide dismutase